MNRRDPESLADWQRDAAHARAALVRQVDKAAAAASIDQVLGALIAQLEQGTADAALVDLVKRANARKRGGEASVTRSTFYRWRTALKTGGVWALAPDETHHERIPPFARAALQLWQKPAKPSIQYVHEHIAAVLAPHGIAAPSYGQLRRFITTQLGALARNAGRMGPRELKTIAPFVRRRTNHLWPGDCYTADGHTFDAEVAHPAHGKPFRPEITLVLDVATRKVVGFSVALDESGLAVLDAQRRAFTTHGICAIWYVDRGSGYANALQHCEQTGIAARLGFEIRHALPYNSQARGLIERAHQTILVRAAKALPTYVGAAMDKQAKDRVFKLTRRDVKSIGASPLLMPWDAFVPFIQQAIDEYDDRPHRALEKVRGDDGRLRHQTPNEAWRAAIAQNWTPVMPEGDLVGDLFFPQTIKKVSRGEIRLHGHTYFSRDLAEWHDELVKVAYDIHDPTYVIVRDQRGRLLTRAELNGNVRDYFAESVIEQAARKRAEARQRRLQVRMDEVADELAGNRTIEHATPLRPGVLAKPASSVEALDAAVGEFDLQAKHTREETKRPVFEFESDRYEWLMANRAAWRDGDAGFCSRFAKSELYAELIERYEQLGIAWQEEAVPPKKAAD